MATQAGASKAVRNAILAGLPDGLVEAYYKRARSVSAQEAEKRWAKMLVAFREYGVTREMIEAHVGHALENLEENEFADLQGIFNSIRDGVVMATDVFVRSKPEEPAPEDTATVDDIVGQGAEVTSGAQAPVTNGESPSERSPSTVESVDPVAAETPAEREPTIGADGGLVLINAAKARAMEVNGDAGEILSAVAEHFGEPDLTVLPKSQLAEALRLVMTAEFEPGDEPIEKPEEPQGPPNEEVSKSGEMREAQPELPSGDANTSEPGETASQEREVGF
jgi:hypothetical protein